MKFAKELEEDAVPEWRVKYFDYKQGKKKIKAISRAIRDAKTPPTPFSRARSTVFKGSPLRPKTLTNDGPKGWPANGRGHSHSSSDEEGIPPLDNPQISDAIRRATDNTPSQAIRIPATSEFHPLRRPSQSYQVATNDADGFTRYGSIIGSPPVRNASRPETLNLPDPAMDLNPNEDADDDEELIETRSRLVPGRTVSGPPIDNMRVKMARGGSNNAFEVGRTRLPFRRYVSLASRRKPGSAGRDHSGESERPLIKRIFSPRATRTAQVGQVHDVPLEMLQQIDERQENFFVFLDKEVDKIESFYKSKEEEATNRLQELREQLHLMRDQRLDEIMRKEDRKRKRTTSNGSVELQGAAELSRASGHILEDPAHLQDLPNTMDLVYHPIKAVRQVHFRKATRHANLLATPPSNAIDQRRDYTRKAQNLDIPYLTAKRKLKTAMQEFYRGLELLKSYALLNRTALRKINKKYDKAVNARPTMRYMTEKVNDAYFVQSTVLDGHLTAVEDLYARYFEKGSHKIAVGKLRKKNRHAAAFTGSVFRNGLFVAAGTVFGIEGLVYGTEILYNTDPVTSAHTSYLLQIYAGYFLLLFLFLLFCFDCMIFSKNKVNYAFVFEFDTRNNLDWRQLSELPCFFSFLLGSIMWLNFNLVGGDTMYLYYPVILIGLTAIIIFCPLPVLYPESRKWFLTSLGRLWLGAGLFPVEFRDFFLGDMFCSQTYSMGNIEVFFCLYAHFWVNPAQCNSSHSRLQGFFTALPGVWRALQCLRRYRDTRNIFPHLVNCGKYAFTILSQVSLNMYRIERIPSMRAFFITCSAINSIYCTFWDIHMDWSLLDPNAEHPFLRAHLAYKQTWAYYLAMVLDPLLRFNWIFYVAFPVELQHSAVLSFAVALSEVMRRGMWTIFRVENEHCTNVGRFRASRDIPLPYKIRKKAHHSDEEPEEHENEDMVKDRQAIAEAGGMGPRQREVFDARATDRSIGSSQQTGPGDRIAVPPSGAASTASSGRINSMYAAVHAATGRDVERQSEAVQSLRRRQAPVQDSLWRKGGLSVRERIGNIMRRAHAQDFERRKPDDDVPPEDSDEEEEQHEEDEEHDSDAEDLQGIESEQDQADAAVLRDIDRQDMLDISDAETYLRRARTEDSD